MGLSLDALQAMTLGSDVFSGNGNFSTPAYWTGSAGCSVSGGQGVFVSVAFGSGLYKTGLAVSGTFYSVTYTILSITGTVAAWCGSWGVSRTVPGTYTETVYCSGINSFAGVFSSQAGTNAVIDDISVREIPGIHATQVTTANKPILRRGLLNLAAWSMDVSNAAWGAIVAGSASAISRTPSYTTSPDGYPATRIQISLNSGTATGDISYLYQTVIPSTTICTGGIYIRSNTTDCSMYMRIGNSEYTIAVTSAWTLIPGVCLAGNTSNQFGFGLRGGQSSPCSNSIDVSIASAGLFKGTYTAQQIIDAGGIPLTTSAAASSTTGKYWWQFDGSNDSLSLGAPLFQMSDDHCVICAFSSTSTAATVSIFALSGATPTPLAPIIQASPSANQVQTTWRDDSGTSITLTNAYTLGEVCVASARKSGSQRQARKNGVVGGTSTTAMGPTTLTEATIGSWSVPSFHQGSIYPVIAIKGTVTDSDLLTLERFVGQLSGVSGI